MELTKDDAPICRILFNKETHAMALTMYGDRAKEIYGYIRKEIIRVDFIDSIGWATYLILSDERTCDFFFMNNILDYSKLEGLSIKQLLIESPIAEKIWESGKLNPYINKLDWWDFSTVLTKSPITEKIWDSNLYDCSNVGKLSQYGITKILAESPIAEKIWDSRKLDLYLNYLEEFQIKRIFNESPIAEKIKASGKLKLK